MVDLAPKTRSEPVRILSCGDIHIGKDVFVKWGPYLKDNYIQVRHYVNGKPDTRRGINIQIDFLPNLKKAIDLAFEDYSTAPTSD